MSIIGSVQSCFSKRELSPFMPLEKMYLHHVPYMQWPEMPSLSWPWDCFQPGMEPPRGPALHKQRVDLALWHGQVGLYKGSIIISPALLKQAPKMSLSFTKLPWWFWKQAEGWWWGPLFCVGLSFAADHGKSEVEAPTRHLLWAWKLAVQLWNSDLSQRPVPEE